MPVTVASREDFDGIRRIWEEQFTTEAEYLHVMFNQIMPLCTSYIHREGEEILSVASFMPMLFKNTATDIELSGWYMFGVATLSKAQGRKLAAGIISDAIKEFSSKNYHFVFERPADQSLNNYYLKLGFSKAVERIPYRFLSLNEYGSSRNIRTPEAIKTLSERVIDQIRLNFPKRFEWADPELILGLITLGEVQYNNENLNSSTKEDIYIAIHPLNGIDSSIFDSTFFCFPME